MYQRILIPVDTGKTSARALAEAVKLVSRDTQVRLVYVVEDVYPLDAEAFAYIDYTALQTAARHTGDRALEQASQVVQHVRRPSGDCCAGRQGRTCRKRHRRGCRTLGCRPHRDRHPRSYWLESILAGEYRRRCGARLHCASVASAHRLMV